MYLIIGSLRQFYRAEQFARAGKFKTGTVPAHDPEGKVLGIVGMGGIGRVSRFSILWLLQISDVLAFIRRPWLSEHMVST